MTLTFKLPEQMFQKTNNIILKSIQKCESYNTDNLNLRPFDNLTINIDLDFNLPEKNFQMALQLLKDNNCANYFEIHLRPKIS